jgi:hypothetical protein
MSSDAKMKTVVYAKKLRARLKVLQDNRQKDLKKYANAVHAWRIALKSWVKDVYEARINNITNKELKDKYRRSDQPGFDVYKFFSGAPQPPLYPTDKLIRDVQKKIQYLAIIHLTEVHVSEEEVGRFFSGADEDDD